MRIAAGLLAVARPGPTTRRQSDIRGPQQSDLIRAIAATAADFVRVGCHPCEDLRDTSDRELQGL